MAKKRVIKQRLNRNAPKLDWTIVGRVKKGRVELVQVPIDPVQVGGTKEKLLQTILGPSFHGIVTKSEKSKRRSGEKKSVGMLSDSTGQVALKTFQLAVREAKRR